MIQIKDLKGRILYALIHFLHMRIDFCPAGGFFSGIRYEMSLTVDADGILALKYNKYIGKFYDTDCLFNIDNSTRISIGIIFKI